MSKQEDLVKLIDTLDQHGVQHKAPEQYEVAMWYIQTPMNWGQAMHILWHLKKQGVHAYCFKVMHVGWSFDIS